MSDPQDPLDSATDPHSYWSTTNAGEAMPGVPTPLGWSVWGTAAELATRAGFRAVGALEDSETGMPSREENRLLSVFSGRVAVRVDFLHEMGQRLPGTSGAAIATQVLGFAPPELDTPRTRRRYLAVAARFPVAMATAPRKTKAARAQTEYWWREEVARTNLNLDDARTHFLAAVERFTANVRNQGIAVFCCIQPIFDMLTKLVESTPGDFPGLMGGYGGHEETHTLIDLWAVSRDRLSFDDFVARHGFHGPAEGEISAHVWREDRRPLETTVRRYREMPGDADPSAAAQQRVLERRRQEARLLAALPVHRRGAARLIMRLARSYVPLRGVAKVAFLQSLDAARFAARTLGQRLEDAGLVDDADDVFYLTVDELRAGLPPDTRELVLFRRERRTHYESVEVPSFWQGRVEPLPLDTAVDQRTVIEGQGASPGVVEGEVVVVTDPSDVDLEPGQILVARTTDPSWTAVMFLSGAIVVDIGGLLSHAAVVAREIGVPCVMGTDVGTRVLRTGDRCRVDGSTGIVEILKRNNG